MAVHGWRQNQEPGPGRPVGTDSHPAGESSTFLSMSVKGSVWSRPGYDGLSRRPWWRRYPENNGVTQGSIFGGSTARGRLEAWRSMARSSVIFFFCPDVLEQGKRDMLLDLSESFSSQTGPADQSCCPGERRLPSAVFPKIPMSFNHQDRVFTGGLRPHESPGCRMEMICPGSEPLGCGSQLTWNGFEYFDPFSVDSWVNAPGHGRHGIDVGADCIRSDRVQSLI